LDLFVVVVGAFTPKTANLDAYAALMIIVLSLIFAGLGGAAIASSISLLLNGRQGTCGLQRRASAAQTLELAHRWHGLCQTIVLQNPEQISTMIGFMGSFDRAKVSEAIFAITALNTEVFGQSGKASQNRRIRNIPTTETLSSSETENFWGTLRMSTVTTEVEAHI